MSVFWSFLRSSFLFFILLFFFFFSSAQEVVDSVVYTMADTALVNDLLQKGGIFIDNKQLDSAEHILILAKKGSLETFGPNHETTATIIKELGVIAYQKKNMIKQGAFFLKGWKFEKRYTTIRMRA